MEAEGVNKLISRGSRVIVARLVCVNIGKGVFETFGVPVGGVVVGTAVLITKRSGVNVAGRLNGVAVGFGGLVGVGGTRNGMEIGEPEQPERREMMTVMRIVFFMKHL